MVEAAIAIHGNRHCLWQAIDKNIYNRAIIVQTRRNTNAAKQFFLRLATRFGKPRVVNTDTLRSFIKPIKTPARDANDRAHKDRNNGIEVSHRPTRKIGVLILPAGPEVSVRA